MDKAPAGICNSHRMFVENEQVARVLVAVASDFGDACYWEITHFQLTQQRRLRHEDTCSICLHDRTAA